MIRPLAFALALPLGATADTLPPLDCSGSAPDWALILTDDVARLDFQRQSDMTIPHRTSAEGQDWPQALTLINRFDTAIAIIDKRQCASGPYTAHVLTQRGETPILLTGCCAVIP